MKILLRTTALFGLCAAIVTFAFAQDAKTNRSTVVCLGDSLTRGGYPAELEKLLPIRVINAGIGGNTSRQGLARIDKDVLAHKPALVVVLFGTNDTRRDAPKVHVPLPEYEENLTKIIEKCRGIGAKVILGTIPPIDAKPYFTRHVKEDFDAAGGLEKLLSQYRATALRVGESNQVPVVDLNQLLLKETGWRKDDGVHLTEEGNQLVAKLIAKQIAAVLVGR